MEAYDLYITNHVWAAWIVLLFFFAVLAKCADMFVESSIVMANKFRIPKLVIGIFLVSLATTAPELSVSLAAAVQKKPEMALGNAIGSVICDDGLALALCGIFSLSAIPVIPHVLKTSGRFLLAIEILAFLFLVGDLTLQRWEGLILVTLFVGYMIFLFRQHRQGRYRDKVEDVVENGRKDFSLRKIILLFIISLAGIVIASEFIITSASSIALSFGIPETVIAMTLVAIGTSIPEIATCITAARKNEGALAVGNILGADIMNICWVAGASAMANDLTISSKELYFMFPAMFIIVGAMLIMLHKDYRLTRTKGFVLLGLYLIYLTSFFLVF